MSLSAVSTGWQAMSAMKAVAGDHTGSMCVCLHACAHVWQGPFWSWNKTCKFLTSLIKKKSKQSHEKSRLSYKITVKSLFDMSYKPWTDVHVQRWSKCYWSNFLTCHILFNVMSLIFSLIVVNKVLLKAPEDANMQTMTFLDPPPPPGLPLAQTYRCSLNLSQSTWGESALGLIWFQPKTICRQAFVRVPTPTARWD